MQDGERAGIYLDTCMPGTPLFFHHGNGGENGSLYKKSMLTEAWEPSIIVNIEARIFNSTMGHGSKW